MVFRTVVVGHSQTPTHIQGDQEYEYIILRRPGGLIRHLRFRPLNEVYNLEADLIVFFIGGNDIVDYRNHPVTLASRIRDHLLELKQYAQEVAFVSIENRVYPSRNQFGISTQEYARMRNRVNHNVRRFCRNHEIRYINVNRSIFINNISPDGTHFNAAANDELIYKIRRLAYHAQLRRLEGGW